MKILKDSIYLLRSCRPKQWTKNLIVFSAPLFSFNFLPNTWIPAIYATLSFCLISSSIYLFNDCLDIKADKLHPFKCKRPIASGKVKVSNALLSSVLLALISIFIAFNISYSVVLLVIGYGLIQVFYCTKFKKLPILDLFCISSGFLIRSIAGLMASNLKLSPWFILSVGLLALFLAVEKRKAELMTFRSSGILTRKVLEYYSIPLLLRLESTLVTSVFMSYSLWASGPLLNGAPTSLMLLTVPLVLGGLFRYQLLSDPEEAERRSKENIRFITERPEEVLLSDTGIRLIVSIWISMTLIIGFIGKL